MKRVPAWVVILVFAAVVGTAIFLVAYRRGTAISEFCTSRLPVLPEYERVTDTDTCTTRYSRNGKDVLVVKRNKQPFAAQLAALEQKLRLPVERIASGAILETTVQATAAQRVVLVGRDGDLVELHFDTAIFERDRSLQIAAGL